ncbi:DUF6730 family protein [Salinimicrobium sp. TIG7-5_MAKvit]|uniref:DUF6730 family protein n=1 Tax=Salinimicrobium sp. TIG7-5_MAKvit TaxID=3121289 RepID=UPI003C6E0080
MKKLDEIMELMADEMQDFQVGLLQLKKMTGELQNRSIPISTEVMEEQLNFFFQKQQEKETIAVEKLAAIDEKLKNAYILPKNLGIIFGCCLILLITFIGYLSFEVIESKNDTIEAHQVLEKEQVKMYDRYFSENPEINEAFKNWLQNQNIP